MLKLFTAIISVSLFSIVFFGGEAHANEGPSTIFPDPNDTCHLIGGCLTPRPLYLTVGVGEHISGYTTNEVYVYSSGNISFNLLEAQHCQTYSTAFHVFQSLDFGQPVTTQFQLYRKSGGPPVRTVNVPACNGTVADASDRNWSFTQYLTAGEYYLRAYSPATASSENSYRVQIAGGNARLGAGTRFFGGVSLSMRDLPFQAEFTHALHFAVSCDALGSVRSIRAYDADRGVYQSGGITGSYRDLDWRIRARPRGSGTWNLIASGTATGGNAAYETWLNSVQLGYEYRVEIVGVERPNAIEILLPDTASQNQVNDDCAPTAQPFDYTPRIYREGSSTTFLPGGVVGMRARASNTSTSNGTGDVDLVLRPTAASAPYVTIENTGGSSPVTYSSGAIAWWNRPPIAAGSYWQPSGISRYRVSNTIPPGTTICFYTAVRPDSQSNTGYQYSGQLCWGVEVREYIYRPGYAVTSPQFNGLYYPSTGFSARASVRNSGQTSGPNYRQTIRFSPGSVGGDPYSTTRSALSAGSSSTLFTGTRFTVPSNARHGDPIRCTNEVRPHRGLGPPSPISVTDGVESRTRTCARVENRQFSVVLSSISIPDSVLPGETFDVTAYICNNGSVPANATPSLSASTRTQMSPADALSTGGRTVIRNISYGGGSSDCTSGYTTQFTVASTAQLGDTVCVRVGVNRLTGYSYPVGTGFNVRGNTSQTACTDVSELGYFQVENGSVWSGGNFDPSPVGYGGDYCGAAGSGQIRTSLLNGIGSWADYIAGAAASISNFGSQHIRTGAVNGSGLTYANTGLPGSFGAGLCIDDLYTYLSQDTTRGNVDVLPGVGSWPAASRQWIRNGNWRVSTSQTLGPGDRITVVVDGDVTINGNIEFANYNVADTSLIPSFILVVNGDINITSNVTRLDGFYFARPNAATGSQGVIDTCSNQPDPAPFNGRLASTICGDQLLVNGGFTANDIEFRRTHGGVTGGNVSASCPTGTCPAEVFRWNSEFFLAEHFLVSENQPDLKIDNQVDLPPVLN